MRRTAAQRELPGIVAAHAYARPRVESHILRIVKLEWASRLARCGRSLPCFLVQARWKAKGVENKNCVRLPESTRADVGLIEIVHALSGGCPRATGPCRRGKQVFPERNRLNGRHRDIGVEILREHRRCREVVHAGFGIFEIDRHCKVPLLQ